MAVVWIIASYLLGSIPFAYIVALVAKGIDIRRYGTRNVGGSNVGAHVSFAAFLLVALLDIGKGVLAVELGRRLGLDLWWLVASGWAAMIGHNWSIFLKGSGGKGLFAFVGGFLALAPVEAVISIILAALSRFLPRWGNPVYILLIFTGLPFLTLALGEPVPVIFYPLGGVILHLVKRVLDVQPPWEIPAEKRKEVVIYRLFLDRDTRDRESWIYRKPKNEVAISKKC